MTDWPDSLPESSEADLSGDVWMTRAPTVSSTDIGPNDAMVLETFAALEQERYERRQLLGLGGMGKVTCVYDRRLKRPVALKELRPERNDGDTDSEGSERLAREVWITANLEHPGIVPVYDAGLSDGERLYYTMRLIRGRSLHEALVAQPALHLRQGLLRTFLRACEAVAYAHSRGIIHRDLKPTNIMVGEFGETQVVDWGLARRIEAPAYSSDEGDTGVAPSNDDARACLTMAGSIVGTPAYMSPEQASGKTVDAATDVWSLGAVLFEVVTGRPAMTGSGSELLFKLKATDFQFAPEVSEVKVPSELMAVILRAMATAPEDRYANAGELATDVARFLDGRQVAAYDYSGWELVARLARRWRTPLTVGITMLLVAIVVGIWGYTTTVTERDRAVAAEAEARRAERASKRAEGQARRAQQEATASKTTADHNLSRALLGRALEAQRAGAHPEAETFAVSALRYGDSAEARGILAALGGSGRPTWAWRRPAPEPCPNPQLNPDASLVACLHAESLELWELGTSPTRRWKKPYRARNLAFIANDDVMAGTLDGRGLVLSGKNGDVLKRFEDFTTLDLIASPSGRYVVATHYHHRTVIDTRNWERFDAMYRDNLLHGSSFSGDEQAILTGRESGYIERAPLRGPYERLVKIPFPSDVRALSLSPDQTRLLLASLNGDVTLLDVDSGDILWRQTVAARPIVQAEFCESGELIAVAGEREGIVVFEASTGQRATVLPARWSRQFVWVTNRELVTLGRGAVVKWKLAPSIATISDDEPHGLSNATISPNERWLAVADGGGRFRILNPDSGEHVKTLRWQHRVARYAAFTRSNRYLVVSAMSNAPFTRVYEVGTWKRVPVLDDVPAVRRILALRGDRVIVAHYMRNRQLVYSAGAPDPALQKVLGPYLFVDVGADEMGRRAALLDGGTGTVMVYDDEHRSLTKAFDQPNAMSAVDIDVNGTIAVGSELGIHLRTAEGQLLRRFVADGFQLMDVAFAASGAILAATFKNGAIRLWETSSGKLLARISSGTQRVPTIEFSSSGDWFVTSSWDGKWRRFGMDTLTATIPSLEERVSRSWGLSLDDLLSDAGQ